jgi:hypothetical protein
MNREESISNCFLCRWLLSPFFKITTVCGAQGNRPCMVVYGTEECHKLYESIEEYKCTGQKKD